MLAVVFGRIWETRKAVEQTRRDRMAPIYERLVTIFYSAASDNGPPEEEMQVFFQELAQRLLVWGPEEIIKAFVQWRAELDVHADSPQAILAFERLLVAMRKDLGTKSGGLASGDLLRVFVNDLDEHLPPSALGSGHAG